MKFLVLFLAVLLQQQVPATGRLNQKMGFDRWMSFFERSKWFNRASAVVQLLLVAVLPAVAIGALFWWLESIIWGLPALLAEVVLLLVLLAQANVGKSLNHYRDCLASGDNEGAYLCASQTIAVPGLELTSDASSMNRQVLRSVMYRWFEFFFVMVFWYLIADVGGVVLAWATLNFVHHQKRKQQAETVDQAAEAEQDSDQNSEQLTAVAATETGEAEAGLESETDSETTPQESASKVDVRLAATCLYWLEWVPARLLGLTYCLAGNMTLALPVWRSLLWNTGASSQTVLADVARAALSMNAMNGSSVAPVSAESDVATAELEEWHQLHLRSESVWLVMIAVATIGGWLL